MAMLMSVMSFAVETVAYTLTTTATGENKAPHNAYASAAEATYDGITWNVTGNSSMEPWRIGGKSITAVNRAVYSKTAMAADITKIEITHATVNLTCNSCVLTISDAANGEGETFPVTVTQNTTTTITLPEGDYSNKFYKLVYNVTNTTTSNKYVQLKEIKFYTEVQTSVEAPTFTPEEGKVAANNTFAEPFALTIASATEGATIKYTLDGTDPALETALTYEAPITISTMVQVRAIAVKGEESSVEATATYIVASTEEKPYTASEAIAAEALGLTGNVYVTGTVKSIEELSTQYGNATYNITDGVKELKIYRGKNLENAKFTSADQLLVGDVVVVKGDLTSYNGAAQLGQNNYLISRSTPVVSYVVTVSANPAEAGTVAGGGSFDENEEITVTATANEGYEFVNWTVDGEEVSTDAEYTFSVTADLALVANFKEVVVEPEYMVVEDKINNFVFDTEAWPMVCSGGPSAEYGVEVYLVLTEDADGTLDYDQCSVSIQGQDVTFIDGTLSNIDPYTPSADAVLHVQMGEEYFELHLAMAGAPATVTEIVLTDAIVAINEDLGTLTFNVPTDEGEGYYAELAGYTAPGVHEGPQICLFMTPEAVAYTNYAETSVADGVITLTGEFATADGSAKFNVTISGKLPVVEPAGVTYNVTVPEGTYACYIAGEMNEWTHQEMNKVDDTHYTITIEGATTEMKYKYCSGPEWQYVEKDANGNDVPDRTYAENDVVASWAAIYNPNPTVEPETTWTVAGSVIFGSEWTPADAANDMTLQNDGTYKWEKIGLELAANTKIEFKVVKNHAWGEEYPSANYVLTIAEDGIYTVTITFNPSTKEVVALVTKTGDADVEVEISYVLMGVQGDWETGIALTQNPENANEYILLGQEILKGDAVKVVTMTNGKKTAYCGNVEEWTQVAYGFDADGNIVLKPGKYDFYYKVDGDIIYIGGEAYPEVIAYELDGGELPTVTVPTQEELWNSFQTAAGLSLGTLENINAPVLNTISGNLNANNLTTVFGNQEWQWLKSYIKTTQDAQVGGSFVDANNITRSVPALEEEIPASGTGLINWRYAVAAFFVQGQYVGYPAASADFTEAGKPEVWGAAYEAEYGVVLPTEPVAEDYVLPTPTKEGYKFVGWYDNAAGEGDAYEVIPAGWSGTLYAIWEQDTTTALENIAVEGKAVKAIINGQLIIIKNGVQYNAQGQVVK